MKNNKQIKNKKRNGLYIGLGISLAAITAGTTAAVSTILFKNNNSLQGKVQFNAGSGHTFADKSSFKEVDAKSTNRLLDLSSKLKVVNNDGSDATDFVGWAKSSDFVNNKVDKSKIISANSNISDNTKLRAVFTSDVNGDGIVWLTVSFQRGDAAKDIYMTGNTKFSILSGTTLREINAPYCEPKSEGELKFVGWKQSGTTNIFTETTPITTDIIFEPIMSVAAKIEFVAPDNSTISGSTSISVALNTKFGDINTPIVTANEPTKYVFGGWYKDKNKTIPFSPDDLISSDDVKAYGLLVDVNSTDYCIIKAVAVTGVTYEGNTEFAVKNNTPWKSYNRPIPICLNQELDYWQYSTDNGTTWKKAEGNTAFNHTTTPKPQIRPVMKSTIAGISLEGPESGSILQPLKIVPTVLPTTSVQTVDWEIYADAEFIQPVTEEFAKITEKTVSGKTYGELVIEETYPTAIGTNDIYIKVASKVATGVTNSIHISIVDPFVDSSDYWVYNGTDSTYDKGWYKLSNLNKPTMPIKLTKLGDESTTKSINRTDFNMPITVGNKVTEIMSNFLVGCTSFDSTITLNTDTDYRVKICDNFLAGCIAYNQSFDFTKVSSIGDDFLIGCSAFAQSMILSNVKYIGNNFLKGHTTYNQLIDLTGNTVLKSIGNSFLEGCSVFNQNLYLPSSIVKKEGESNGIGSHFLYEAQAYASTITVECGGEVFDPGMENLSTLNPEAPIATDGFTVAGTKKDEVPYNTLDGSIGGYYRTVKGKQISEKQKWLNKYSTFLSNYEKMEQHYATINVGAGSKYYGLDITKTTTAAVVIDTPGSNISQKSFKFYECSSVGLNDSYAGRAVSFFSTAFDTLEAEGYTMTYDYSSDDNISFVAADANGQTIFSQAVDSNTYATKVYDAEGSASELIDLKDITYSTTAPAEYTEVTYDYNTNECSIDNVNKKKILINTGTKLGDCTYQPSFTAKSGFTIKGLSADSGSTIIDPATYEVISTLSKLTVVCESGTVVPTLPDYLTLTKDGELSVKVGSAGDVPTTLEIQSKYKVDGVETEVKSIAAAAFIDTKIKEVVIPATVTSIGETALNPSADTLKSLSFTDAPCTWKYNGNYYTFTTDTNLNADVYKITMASAALTKENVEELPDWAEVTQYGTGKYEISAKSGETVPEDLVINSAYIFKDEKGTSIVNITAIADGAFDSKALKTLTLPDSIEEIKTDAFKKTSLTDITIPKKTTTIGASALDTGKLANLTFADETSKWEGDAGGKLTPSSKPSDNAKNYLEISSQTLTKVEEEHTLPDYFTLDETSEGSGKYTLSLNSGFEGEIGSNLHIASSYIDHGETKNVYSISNFVMPTKASGTITTIEIDDGVQEIDSECCDSLSSVKAVTIPSSVNKIGAKAFDVTSLEEFNISIGESGDPVHWSYDSSEGATLVTFNGNPGDDTDTYKNNVEYTLTKADVPSYLSADYVNGQLYISQADGYSGSGPEHLVINDYYYFNNELVPVYAIAESGFAGNTTLKSVTLPNKLSEISEKAFENCTFTSLDIPANVTTIYRNAISGAVTELKLTVTEGWKTSAGNTVEFTGDPAEDAETFKTFPEHVYITRN